MLYATNSYTGLLVLIMKYILIILISIFVFFNTPETVKKKNQPYWSVISESDLIVDGEIGTLTDSNYEFKISELIKGTEKKIIKVGIWEEWSCDTRLGKLIPKQRLILFLKKLKNGSYQVINGSTGELVVNQDRSIRRNMYHEYPDVYSVKNGIKEFLKSFDCQKKKGSNNKINYLFKRKITQIEKKKLMTTHSFFKYILNRLPEDPILN